MTRSRRAGLLALLLLVFWTNPIFYAHVFLAALFGAMLKR